MCMLLKCNAYGKPEPSITWTRVGSSEVISSAPSLKVVNVHRPGTPDNIIQYQCKACNGVGSPATAIASVTIHCKYVSGLHRNWCFEPNIRELMNLKI